MSLELAETLILPALHRICDERIKTTRGLLIAICSTYRREWYLEQCSHMLRRVHVWALRITRLKPLSIRRQSALLLRDACMYGRVFSSSARFACHKSRSWGGC